MSVPGPLRNEIIERAGGYCEYCRLHQDDATLPHEPDHIIARKHDGPTHSDNLALACFRCNRFKGSDLGSIDPETGELAFFFNPRTQVWIEHFRIEGAVIQPLTPEGRVTVKLMQLNHPDRVLEREILMAIGRYPPSSLEER